MDFRRPSDSFRINRMRNGAYPCSVRVSFESVDDAAIWCEDAIGDVAKNWDYKVTDVVYFDFYFMDERVAIEFKLLFG